MSGDRASQNPPGGRKRRREPGRSSAVGADDALETLVNQFSDPLVFLRELVQNSLDASSTRVDVELAYDEREGLMTISVLDNGEGMNESIIDRYLLTLFRSTKENDLTKIGKFGVGFVSVFAIKPDLIVLETGQASESWRILFHPDRSFEKLRMSELVEGTSIVLYKRVTAEEYDELEARGAATVRYWCKYAEAEISVNDEPIGQTFGLDAALAVEHREPGTELVVGFAPPRQAEDPERGRLAGREAATALAPLCGFYNRGLTLIEAGEPPNPGSREAVFLAGLSVRVKSRYLEHTLTRDNVRQDENYAKAMKLLCAQVEGRLRERLLEHLQALAAYHSGLADDPGAPDLEMALLYARLPSMRLHEVAERAAIVPTVTGAPVSLQALRESDTPTGTVLYATERNPVTELLRARGIPVVLGRREVREHLQTLGMITKGADGADAHAVDDVLVTALPVDVTAEQQACLERVGELLERAKVKVDRVLLGDLAYPGSKHSRSLYLRQERAFALTRPGVDDQVTWLGGARDLVLNRNRSLVERAMALAARDPALAAQLLAQAVCTWECADINRSVGLARTALSWRETGRSAAKDG